MDEKIIEKLTALSQEEKEILAGNTEIRRDNYSVSDKFIINREKLLDKDRQILLRPHTRFADFPEHGHDYMEIMYVYRGSVTHVIDRGTVVLESGDILFLNRHIRHSIRRADADDIGLNFILSNDFLNAILPNVENNPVISGFLERNMQPDAEGEYLFFKTQDIFPIRNLMENLIYALTETSEENYSLQFQLVSLLFTYLAVYRETLSNSIRLHSPEKQLRSRISDYINNRYTQASLKELAGEIGYSPAYLSRRIRTLFGTNFSTLVEKKRIEAAAHLLRTTSLSVEEIIRTVGYENQTHFHQLFRRQFGTTPLKFRLQPEASKDD